MNSAKQPKSKKDIQSQLDSYLKENEKKIAAEEKLEKRINEIREENKKKREGNEGLEAEELFKLIIEEMKAQIELEENINLIKLKDSNMSENTKEIYSKSIEVDAALSQLEAQNSSILEQIKNAQAEMKEIENAKNDKLKEMQKKCDDCKADFMTKYQSFSNEAIIKENEDLKIKLEEVKENTNKIRQAIKVQNDFRLKQEESLKKLTSAQPEDSKTQEENERLQKEVDAEQEIFASFEKEIKNYTKKFQSSQKDFEKSMKEYASILNENRTLKMYMPEFIKEEIEKNQKKLEFLVKENKGLRNKISEAKLNKEREGETKEGGKDNEGRNDDGNNGEEENNNGSDEDD